MKSHRMLKHVIQGIGGVRSVRMYYKGGCFTKSKKQKKWGEQGRSHGSSQGVKKKCYPGTVTCLKHSVRSKIPLGWKTKRGGC